MDFLIKSGNADKQRNACIIVGIFDYRKLTDEAEALDKLSDGAISAITRRGDIDGKLGQTLVLYQVPNTLSDRILLIGLGKERDFTPQRYYQAQLKATEALLKTGARDASNFITLSPVKGRDEMWNIRQAAIASDAAMYRFQQMKSEQKDPQRLNKLLFHIHSRRYLDQAETALEEGLAIAAGVELAKDLGNLPGNICTPNYLAERALELAEHNDNTCCTILEEADMEREGMGALLAVSRGSREPAKLIVIEYNGGAKDADPIALVGKGLTFDAGGISIKPAGGMDEMKFDMCGGASVLGALTTAVELQLPLNIVGIIPASENLPDGAANKPGDILTSMSGKTIEILNTDAEGRLILCDALTYAARYKPSTVIDIATLTGACVVALGEHATGMYSNDRSLARELTNSGEASGDRVWEMPLWDDYQSQIDSHIADIANVGGRSAGSITAACFLARFTKDYRSAHLVIAGTAC